jgi:hypothetical protein
MAQRPPDDALLASIPAEYGDTLLALAELEKVPVCSLLLQDQAWLGEPLEHYIAVGRAAAQASQLYAYLIDWLNEAPRTSGTVGEAITERARMDTTP